MTWIIDDYINNNRITFQYFTTKIVTNHNFTKKK